MVVARTPPPQSPDLNPTEGAVHIFKFENIKFQRVLRGGADKEHHTCIIYENSCSCNLSVTSLIFALYFKYSHSVAATYLLYPLCFHIFPFRLVYKSILFYVNSILFHEQLKKYFAARRIVYGCVCV